MKCSYKINKCGYKSVKLVWCEDYSNDVDKTINVWFQYNVAIGRMSTVQDTHKQYCIF